MAAVVGQVIAHIVELQGDFVGGPPDLYLQGLSRHHVGGCKTGVSTVASKALNKPAGSLPSRITNIVTISSSTHLVIVINGNAKAHPVRDLVLFHRFRYHSEGEEFFPRGTGQRGIQRGVGKDSRGIRVQIVYILRSGLEHQLAAVHYRRIYSIPLLAGFQLCPGVKHAVAGNLYGLGGT